MKYLLKSIFILCFALLLNACFDLPKNETENLSLGSDFNTVKVNDQYSIALPKYMKEAVNLNGDASLQYQNIFKEVYITVIDEPKQELIEIFKELDEWDDSKSVVKNYRDIQLQFLSEGIAIENRSDPRSIKINGLDAEVMDIDGKVEDVAHAIAYRLAFIEGNEKVYVIMAWTLKDKRKKLQNTFQQIIMSFELL